MNTLKKTYFVLQLFCVLAGTVLYSSFSFSQEDTKHYIAPFFGRESQGDHYLTLSTSYPSPFDVTVSDGSGNLIATTTISASNSQTILVGHDVSSPFMLMEIELNQALSHKGLIVEGDHPFTALVRVIADEQSASLISKGYTHGAGTHFKILHPYNNDGFAHDKSNAFSVMATENNTQVSISDINAGVILKNMPNGGAPLTTNDFAVVLNAGESITFSNFMDDGTAINNLNGLNGTDISSNKPIVVNSGSWLGGNAIIGTSTNGMPANGRDIGVDQLIPLEEAGTAYVLTKGKGFDNERTVIIASADNTQIFLSGTQIATLNEGDVYYLSSNQYTNNNAVLLEASNPIYVGQMLNAGNGVSDDFERQFDFSALSPITCTGSRDLKIPEVDFLGSNSIEAIVDAGHDLYINGTLVSTSNSISGTSDYVSYSINNSYSGDVVLSSTGLIRAHLLNLNGHQGASSYFAGFAKEISMSAAYTNNVGTTDSTLIEGCGSVTITISREQHLINEHDTIPLISSGSATEFTDYTNIPDEVIFTPGDTAVSFTIDILSDVIQESSETVIIEMNASQTACGMNMIEFLIEDYQELGVNMDYTAPTCPGETVNITPVITGGVPSFAYTWNTNQTSDQIAIIPNGPTLYNVQVTDACGNTNTASAVIGIAPYSLNIISSNDQNVYCPYTDIDLFAEATGGTHPINYDWYFNGITVDQGAFITTPATTTGDFVVVATDACGISITDTTGAVVEISLLEVSTSNDTLICAGDEIEVLSSVTGGLPPYEYNWSNGDNSSSTLIEAANDQNISVSVYDACNTYEVNKQVSIETQKPDASFQVISEVNMVGLPIQFMNQTSNAVTYEWNLDENNWSSDLNPMVTYEEDGWKTIQLDAYDAMGCHDSSLHTLFIEPEFYFYAPNSFSPNGDGLNNYYEISTIGAESLQFDIFDRWGNLIYSTSDLYFQWDGTFNGSDAPDGVYVFKCTVADKLGRKQEKMGHITLLR